MHRLAEQMIYYAWHVTDETNRDAEQVIILSSSMKRAAYLWPQ